MVGPLQRCPYFTEHSVTRTTSTQERQSQVGFIGLGVMGQAMCLNLARKLSTIK
ncbi:MAG: hypothetical protein EBT07_10085, partial [Actinobacteria bacterium]|nr:hypothetical protein [Actinomycetota bacterium]